MKKKLSLGKLKVSSFITKVEDQNSETVKGGIPAPQHSWKWCDPHSKQYFCQVTHACPATMETCPSGNGQLCNTDRVCDH